MFITTGSWVEYLLIDSLSYVPSGRSNTVSMTSRKKYAVTASFV